MTCKNKGAFHDHIIGSKKQQDDVNRSSRLHYAGGINFSLCRSHDSSLPRTSLFDFCGQMLFPLESDGTDHRTSQRSSGRRDLERRCFLNDEIIVGLSLNGGSCIAYGTREIPWLPVLGGSGILNATHQWVLLPSDGLKKGTNTFALCGGGANSASDTIDVGQSSLVVQISK